MAVPKYWAKDSFYSPPEICQSFKEVLSTLRSVRDAHWARVVASALGVCLAGIRPEGKVAHWHSAR